MAPRRPHIAALGSVALIAVLLSSDFYASSFWLGHPVTTAILASLTVVLVSVTVIEVVLNRRSERRWRLLAQYALLELAEAARGAWVCCLASFTKEIAAATIWLTPLKSSRLSIRQYGRRY